jgi:hypothetical protein
VRAVPLRQPSRPIIWILFETMAPSVRPPTFPSRVLVVKDLALDDTYVKNNHRDGFLFLLLFIEFVRNDGTAGPNSRVRDSIPPIQKRVVEYIILFYIPYCGIAMCISPWGYETIER